MTRKTMIIVHHSGAPGSTYETIDKTHRNEKGFTRIGYHMVIEKNGRPRKGREDSDIGAHTLGIYNQCGLGVCLCGDFNKSGINPIQWSALVKVIAEWCVKHGIVPSASTIVGHKDKQPKKKGKGKVWDNTCPGNNVYARLPELRSEVATRIASLDIA